MVEKTLEQYFSKDELEGAKSYIEIFHDRLLLSDELGRADKLLLGIYMLSNRESKSELATSLVKEFLSNQLGLGTTEISKGVYDLKSTEQLDESNDRFSLTFKGLKKIRQLLNPSSKAK